MKTYLLKLRSTVKHGVGTPDVELLNLIYSILLGEFELNYYNQIDINQVGNDLNEFVEVKGKKVWINIRYPVSEDFQQKSFKEKNLIRLDVIHTALLRLCEEEKKMDRCKLETLRNKILEKDFSFDILYNCYTNKKNENLKAKVIIKPSEDAFNFYAVIEEGVKEKCNLLIYVGKPIEYYINTLFFYGKWKGLNEFIITGKQKEMEIHIKVNECTVEYINVSGYKDKAPFFEMMKAGKSNKEKDKDYQDWVHSLPPAMAAIITQESN